MPALVNGGQHYGAHPSAVDAVLPGRAVLRPERSPQQAQASDCGPSDSPKVITKTASFLNAGEEVMAGTHC